MQARMENPGLVLPEATKAIQDLVKAAFSAGVPRSTMELVHLRASQINGCSYCVASGSTSAKKAGESDERIFGVAAWREAPWFDEAERAALALAEAMTRLNDRPDAVSEDVWDAAAKNFDERQLAGLILWIATSNLFNRINTAVRQPAGEVHWGDPS
ncbi:MAG TPA: carboxymuconolactone decarboxylase family protein [Acidimicrobiales bacterium]|nr:carboxymuconolactone decarboxylase family protein [Acidimicrobiales bacterium]